MAPRPLTTEQTVLIGVLLGRRFIVGPLFWAASTLMIINLLVAAFLISGMPRYLLGF